MKAPDIEIEVKECERERQRRLRQRQTDTDRDRDIIDTVSFRSDSQLGQLIKYESA